MALAKAHLITAEQMAYSSDLSFRTKICERIEGSEMTPILKRRNVKITAITENRTRSDYQPYCENKTKKNKKKQNKKQYPL